MSVVPIADQPTAQAETQHWRDTLHHDPLRSLLSAESRAVRFWAQRDLVGHSPGAFRALWELPECRRILARQLDDGRWRYSGGNPAIRSQAEYDQLETYRQLGILVAKYGLDRRHPAIRAAVSFLGSFQTDAGDFRGIYGRQYTPNYTGAIAELMIRAGCGDDGRVDAALRWLVTMRQDDGGWAIPTRTLGLPLSVMWTEAEPFEPDRSKPSAHLVTGMVLRALVAHPRYRRRVATQQAGQLLKQRFFTRDRYTDHAAASYWTIFSYPFWWTDLLSSLDTLTRAGFTRDDVDIASGLDWFVNHQDRNGLWNAGHNRPKSPDSDLWVALAICRLLRRVSAR